MAMEGVVVKQLDHVIARTHNAAALHHLLSETFQLPVAWPVSSHSSFTSGGITLGNTYLEILTVGPPGRAGRSASPRLDEAAGRNPCERESAWLCAFAFECVPLKETVEEFRRRGLKASAVVPYVESPAEGEPKAHLWSNAFLDGLVGSDLWTRYVIFSTRTPGYSFWARLMRGSRIERSGMSRLFSRALVFMVEYNYQNFHSLPPQWSGFKNHDEKRAADKESLMKSGGGPLGLESVKEIVVNVKDYERASANWKKLFAPTPPVADGLWEVADGPAVRLVPGERDEIQSLVLKVSDLERAETFLREKGMLDSTVSGQVKIEGAKIHGLNIQLV